MFQTRIRKETREKCQTKDPGVALRKPQIPRIAGLVWTPGSPSTYLNGFTGVLQLADHSLNPIIASHKDGDAITELRLMKRKKGLRIVGISQSPPTVDSL